MTDSMWSKVHEMERKGRELEAIGRDREESNTNLLESFSSMYETEFLWIQNNIWTHSESNEK